MLKKAETKEVLYLENSISLKRLEEFYAFNKVTDELYEIDERACDFLSKCDGARKIAITEPDQPFIDFCLEEKILSALNTHALKREIKVYKNNATPSLRYLELLITGNCNLNCKHCYIDRSNSAELSLDIITNVFEEFESVGGLRLMVSGGEPILHKDFKTINRVIGGYDFRSILLTNGVLLNKYIINELNFNEVQISIDGLRGTHDQIRGEGCYDKALKSMELLLEAGIDVSAATMILKDNVEELDELGDILTRLGVRRWEVDVPCALNGEDVFMDYETAGKYFKHGFSSGLYNSAEGYACGAHLVAVTNTGKVSKCSFFADHPVGDVSDGLLNNFKRLKKIKLDELECDCSFVEECRGGCRYRAFLSGGINKKDIAKCGFYLQKHT